MHSSCFFSRSGLFIWLMRAALLLSVVLVAALVEVPFGCALTQAASGQPNFALQPVTYDRSEPLTQSYFIFDDKPGTVVNSQVRVTNAGTAKGTALLYPVDATTGQTSGAVYLNHNDPRRDVGAWMSIGLPQVTLNAGQSQIVPFRLTLPAAVRPGQHLGGIVAENATTQQSSVHTPNKGTFQIQVKSLTIIAVQVNLPGPVSEQLIGTGIQAGGHNGYQQLLLGLSNQGTVMLKPFGTLQVTDAHGHLVVNTSLKLDTFLPQTSIHYPVTITGQGLGAGRYQAVVALKYGSGKVLHYSTPFTIEEQQVDQVFTAAKTQAPPGLLGENASLLPLWGLAAGGFIFLLAVGGGLSWHRAGRRMKPAGPTRFSQFKGPVMTKPAGPAGFSQFKSPARTEPAGPTRFSQFKRPTGR